MTKIYLVRHAQAEGNLYRRAHGMYDSLVTLQGYAQIEALRRRFAANHLVRGLFPRRLRRRASPCLRACRRGLYTAIQAGALLAFIVLIIVVVCQIKNLHNLDITSKARLQTVRRTGHVYHKIYLNGQISFFLNKGLGQLQAEAPPPPSPRQQKSTLHFCR